MSETPSNERVTTRDLILGIDSKIDKLDERVQGLEQRAAGEDGAAAERERQAKRRIDTNAGRLALYAFLVQVPAAIVYTLALRHP